MALVHVVHKIKKALGMVPAHEQVKRLTEYELYPEHDGRVTSSLFEENRKKLIHEDKHPCFFCGHTLDEAKAAGYTLESHHWFEYTLFDDIDTVKMKSDLEKLDFYGYAENMKDTPITSPDDIRNQLILCSSCHRENGYGIHGATIPFVWARRVLKDKNTDVLRRATPLK